MRISCYYRNNTVSDWTPCSWLYCQRCGFRKFIRANWPVRIEIVNYIYYAPENRLLMAQIFQLHLAHRAAPDSSNQLMRISKPYRGHMEQNLQLCHICTSIRYGRLHLSHVWPRFQTWLIILAIFGLRNITAGSFFSELTLYRRGYNSTGVNVIPSGLH